VFDLDTFEKTISLNDTLMPIQHVFYIPTIFLLGVFFGFLINGKNQAAANFDHENKRNHKLFDKEISRQKLILSLLIFLTIFIITHAFEIPWAAKSVQKQLGGIELFDKKPVFSSEEVYLRISQFKEEGIRSYKYFTFTMDVIFPLSMFAFIFTLSRFVMQKLVVSDFLKRMLLILPIVWLSLDFLENGIVFKILHDLPIQHHVLAGGLGFVTVLKFGMLIVSFFSPLVLFVLGKKS